MLLEKIKLSNNSENISSGDIVCSDYDGFAKKISCQADTFKVIGVCFKTEKENDLTYVSVATNGIIEVNTLDDTLDSGDLVVAEIDGTVKCKTPADEDIDIIGMVMKKAENGKVLVKLR